jgi:hypothetical protein
VPTHDEIAAELRAHLAKKEAVMSAARRLGAQYTDGTEPITEQDSAEMDKAQTALIAWQIEESRLRRTLEETGSGA